MGEKPFIARKGLRVLTGNVGFTDADPAVSLDMSDRTDAMHVPTGNTGNRPTGANGMFRYNDEDEAFEGYKAGAWGQIGAGGGYYKGNDGAVGNTNSKANLFRLNSNTLTQNTTILAGENASTTGPLEVVEPNELTINTGGRVVIL